MVVPLGSGAADDAIASATALEAALSSAQVPVISLHDARDRFTARSRPPLVASDSDVDVLAREARDAVEHVAFGRTAAARKSVREVISRAERTLESLNRETTTARRILDACLSLVRTSLQGSKRDLALEQATRCRRLVPDLVPSEEAHPANVVGVLAEADNLLRRMRIGHLTVRSAPESNCSVYLNGRHLGATPFHLDRAAAGDYRVQVECGAAVARVHVVQLGDHPVDLLVDTQFDRAVVSDPRLLLRYATAADAHTQAVSHAAQLGAIVQADDVVLIAVDGEQAELSRVHVGQQRLVARALVPWSPRQGFSSPALERAIAMLRAARIDGKPTLAKTAAAQPLPDLAEPPRPAQLPGDPVSEVLAPSSTPGEPETSAPGTAEPAEVRTREVLANERLGLTKSLGYALLGASAAALALGVGFEWRAQWLADEVTSRAYRSAPVDEGEMPEAAAERRAQARELDRLQRSFERADKLRWLGLAGPLLATIGVVLVTEPRTPLPWWSYALGALGVGLVATGAAEIATADRCQLYGALPSEPCRREKDSAARGFLLLTAAVPLLSVPLVQLTKDGPSTAVTLSADSSSGSIRVGWLGSF